jgi:hypothetical protein
VQWATEIAQDLQGKDDRRRFFTGRRLLLAG